MAMAKLDVILLLLASFCFIASTESNSESCRYSENFPHNFLSHDHRISRIFQYMKFRGECELVENSDDAVDYNNVQAIELIRRFFCGLYNDTNHWRDDYLNDNRAEIRYKYDKQLEEIYREVDKKLFNLFGREYNFDDVFPYKCFDREALNLIAHKTRDIFDAFVFPTEEYFRTETFYMIYDWLKPHRDTNPPFPPERYDIGLGLQQDGKMVANILFQTLPKKYFKAPVDDLSKVFHTILQKIWYYLKNNMIEFIDNYKKLIDPTTPIKEIIPCEDNDDDTDERNIFNCGITNLFENLDYIVQQTRKLGWVSNYDPKIPEGRSELAFFLMFGTDLGDTFQLTSWKTVHLSVRHYYSEEILFLPDEFGNYLTSFCSDIFDAVNQKNQHKLGKRMKNFQGIIDLYANNCQQHVRRSNLRKMDCLLSRTMKDINSLLKALENSNSSDGKEVNQRRMALIITLLSTRLRSHVSLKERPDKSEVEIVDIAKTTMEHFMDQIYTNTRNNEVDNMKKIASYLPSITFFTDEAIRSQCSQDIFKTLSLLDTMPCLVESTIQQIQLFLSSNEEINGNFKIIKSSINYQDRLFNVQLQNILQQTESNRLIIQSDLAKFTATVNEQFSNRFGALETYFKNLASFDQIKTDADIGFIESRLASFTRDTESDEIDLSAKTNALMIGMLTIKTVNLASAIVMSALTVSQSINPLDPSPADILDSYNKVAQAVFELGQAGVTATAFEEFLETKKNIAKNFNSNYDFLNNTRRIVGEFKSTINEDDFQNKTEWFLAKYTEYDPKVQRQDLVVYQTKWEAFVDEACDEIFNGESIPSQVVKAVFSGLGTCKAAKVLVQKLMATYAEMYDYQFDYIETLAVAVRSRNSKRYAQGLSSRYIAISSQDDAQNSDSTKMFIYKQSALGLYMTYRSHAREAISSFCNYFQFKNAGQRPSRCSAALQTMSPDEIARLSSMNIPTCTHQTRKYAKIPIFKHDDEKSPFHRSSIDISKLYNGDEVLFQIPGYQWLIDNDWIADQSTDVLENTALYLSDFRIYILSDPDQPKTSIITETEAISAAKINPNQAKSNEYRITPKVIHTFSYDNNARKRGCMNEYIKLNPYGKHYKGICITSATCAKDNGDLIPSVFSLWKIKVSRQLPLPKHATKSDIKVGIQLCKRRKDPDSPFKSKVKKKFDGLAIVKNSK